MTMKRICALLMLLALLCVGISALADDYGTAVISGGTSGKVHLREEPSFESDSMGLFFTGTPVKLLEEMGGDFTRVRIGVESGYMFTDYLRRGAAADKVKPQFWQGEITATNYANMRRGPSTEYQFLGRINEGRSVTIMGETRENWYYIEADGKEGYISARLVYTNGTPVSSPSNSAIYIQPDIPAAAYDDMHPAYAQVMLGQQPLFYAAHGSAAYIGNVGTCFDLGGEAQPTHFAVLNMDGDAAQEIVLKVAVNGREYGYLVLDEQKGQVHGYSFFYRGMIGLRADGSFSYASSAAESGFGGASFIGQICRVTPTACTGLANDGGIEYFVGGVPVSEAAYNRACDVQDSKPEAIWIQFTDGNVRARFGK